MEKSHTFGAGATFWGWFPFIGAGAEVSLNRNMDTALGRSVNFNSAKWTGGVSIPLQWIRGRAAHSLFGALSYNHEQLYYRGIGKNIFSNKGFNYIRAGSVSAVPAARLNSISIPIGRNPCLPYTVIRSAIRPIENSPLTVPGIFRECLQTTASLFSPHSRRETACRIFTATAFLIPGVTMP